MGTLGSCGLVGPGCACSHDCGGRKAECPLRSPRSSSDSGRWRRDQEWAREAESGRSENECKGAEGEEA
eukprot:11946413-Alexandrium_andersonii.AAC.1